MPRTRQVSMVDKSMDAQPRKGQGTRRKSASAGLALAGSAKSSGAKGSSRKIGAFVKSSGKTNRAKMVAGSHATRKAGTVATVAGWIQAVPQTQWPIPLGAEPSITPTILLNAIMMWLTENRARQVSPKIDEKNMGSSAKAFREYALQLSKLESCFTLAGIITRTTAEELIEPRDEHKAQQTGKGIWYYVSKEAVRVLLAFQKTAAEVYKESGIDAPLLQTLVTRIADTVVKKIAVCLHRIQCSDQDDERTLSVEEMEDATNIGGYLLDHVMETWKCALQKSQVENARKVLDLVRRKGWSVFSAGECIRSLKGRHIPNVEVLNKALEVLMEHGYIRSLSLRGKNGRSMVRYELNPVFVQGRMDTRTSKVCDKGRRLCPSGSCRKLQARG